MVLFLMYLGEIGDVRVVLKKSVMEVYKLELVIFLPEAKPGFLRNIYLCHKVMVIL